MKKNIIIILVLLFLAIFISGCVDILITPEEDLLDRMCGYFNNTGGGFVRTRG